MFRRSSSNKDDASPNSEVSHTNSFGETKSTSSGWSSPSWSTPGSFRRTKTRMWGPKAMGNDPLESCRLEINEFEALLSVLGSSAVQLQTAVGMLSSAPAPLSESLQKSFPRNDERGGDLVSRLNEKTAMFATRLMNGEQHIQSVIAQTAEMRKTNAAMREQFTTRDDAWQTSMHYESKVQGLREQVIKKGVTSTKLTDKVGRNQQKQAEAEAAFSTEQGKAAKEAHEILETKWSKVGQTLARLCKYYIVIFDGADQLVRDLSILAEEFTRSCSAERDYVQKAAAMAQKARDRASGMAGSAREKMETATAGMAGPASNMASAARENLSSAAGSLAGRFGGAGNSSSASSTATAEAKKSPDGASPRHANGNSGSKSTASPWGSVTSWATGESVSSTGGASPRDSKRTDQDAFRAQQSPRSSGYPQQQSTWPSAPPTETKTGVWGSSCAPSSPWASLGAGSDSAAKATSSGWPEATSTTSAADPWGSPPSQAQKRDPWS